MITALLTAVILPPTLYRLADDGINQQVVIDNPNAVSYDAWQTNVGSEDIEVDYKAYFFDIQNPAEILKGAKPIVQEKGPYSYREYFSKFDIDWTDDGDTVTYTNWKYYIEDQSKTKAGLSFDDQVTIPYATSITFQYLMSGIDEHQTAMLDHLITAKLVNASEKSIAMLDYVTATVESQRVTKKPIGPADQKKNALIDLIEVQLAGTERSVTEFFDRMLLFTNQSNPADLLLKTLLCNTPGGVSPFWKTDPNSATFGWLNDPLLLEVQKLLDAVAPGTPWTNAVPSLAKNLTSEHDARRRRGPDTMKTGKKNKRQVGQIVQNNNMSSPLYVCVNSMGSQNPAEYTEGVEFPACEIFKMEWNRETAEKKGYVLPFETEYANRIQGSDATMFGRPVETEKIQVFVDDIYRTVYLEHKENVEWEGVKLRRFKLQRKDLMNATNNHEMAQYHQNVYNGVENCTAPAGGPVFVSMPHFLDGDAYLSEAIIGLMPNDAEHATHLDIEPQTGLLTQASKRLQMNYLIEPKTFPTAEPDVAEYVHSLCANISQIIYELQTLTGQNITAPSCDHMEALQPLLECLATTSDWSLPAEGILFPASWVDEQLILSDSTGDDLRNSLYFIDGLAVGVQFWCLIIAGMCCATLLAVQINEYLQTNDVVSRLSEKNRASRNIESWASEPFLDHNASVPLWGELPVSPPASLGSDQSSDPGMFSA